MCAINPLAVARYRDRHAVGGGDLVTSKGWLPLFSANAIESLHARDRRAVTARGHFPTEQAALNTLYLVTRGLDPKGTGQARWITRWKPALNAFAVNFSDRMPAAETL